MTFFIPPSKKAKTKGRQASKEDTSTQRVLSYFQRVESFYDSTSPSTSITRNSIKVIKRKKTSVDVPYHKKLRYMDCFLVEIHQYIVNTIDVEANGQCGFQSIVGLLGFGSDGWSEVR